MAFGGVGSMNVVLKNNRNLLSNHRREKFKNGLVGKWKGKVTYDLPKASPQKLRSIRERIQFENEQRKRKQIIVFVSIVFVLSMIMFSILS